MKFIFPTLLAVAVGLFVFIMVWRLLTRSGRARVAAIAADDIDKTANDLIDEHGDEAADAVAASTAECLAAGDFDGAAVWQRVAKAVEKLQSD